jgi:hypothetical protein
MEKPNTAYRFLITRQVGEKLASKREATFYLKDLNINIKIVLADDLMLCYEEITVPNKLSEMN